MFFGINQLRVNPGTLTPRARIRLQLMCGIAICVASSASLAQTSAPVSMSMSSTASRVQSPGWWPTKGDASRDSYVGTATCAKCHASKAATQQKHAMARAAVPAADAEILRQHDHLSFRLGPYHEEIVTKGEKSVLTVPAAMARRPSRLTCCGHLASVTWARLMYMRETAATTKAI